MQETLISHAVEPIISRINICLMELSEKIYIWEVVLDDLEDKNPQNTISKQYFRAYVTGNAKYASNDSVMEPILTATESLQSLHKDIGDLLLLINHLPSQYLSDDFLFIKEVHICIERMLRSQLTLDTLLNDAEPDVLIESLWDMRGTKWLYRKKLSPYEYQAAVISKINERYYSQSPDSNGVTPPSVEQEILQSFLSVIKPFIQRENAIFSLLYFLNHVVKPKDSQYSGFRLSWDIFSPDGVVLKCLNCSAYGLHELDLSVDEFNDNGWADCSGQFYCSKCSNDDQLSGNVIEGPDQEPSWDNELTTFEELTPSNNFSHIRYELAGREKESFRFDDFDL